MADDADDGVVLRKCTQCGVMQTPNWRDGPEGKKTLCNSCGLKYKKAMELEAARPTFLVEGPRKRQPSSRLIVEVSAAAATAQQAPPPPTTRTQVIKRDPVPLPPLPKAFVQSQLGSRISIASTTTYTFEEKFNMTNKPEQSSAPLASRGADDGDQNDEAAASSATTGSDEREQDAVEPPAKYLATEGVEEDKETQAKAATLDGNNESMTEATPANALLPAAPSPLPPPPPPIAVRAEPDTDSEILIVVRIELPTSNERNLSPEDFALAMCTDMQLQEGCRRLIATAIRASCERYAPLRLYCETREDVRLIRLQLAVGTVGLYDQVEWDINNTTNSPEHFARSMCTDIGLSREFEVAIVAAIRAQLQEYRLAALRGRTIGRMQPMNYALRSDKELAAWTPSLYQVKEMRAQGSGANLRPRGQAVGNAPESFRGASSSSAAQSSGKSHYSLRT